jgi:uncharacterized protein (DUF1330 family)
MTAYVVLFREGPVHDPAEMEAYAKKSRETPPDPNLKPLALYGELESLEGAPPDGVVILEFPTMEDARTWYYSPEYQAAAVHRKNGADYRAVIVDGFEGA